MPDMRIRTLNMELIAASDRLIKAELEGNTRLAAVLDAEVEDGWPPETWRDAVEEFMARLEKHPGLLGWLNWYWVLRDGDRRILIGSGGFTGAPFNGEVMIGYSVIDAYQRKGYGAEAVKALVNWAFVRPGVQRIVAETMAYNRASISLLEKCGFEYAGKGFERGTIRYMIPKEKWLLLKN